MGLIDGWTLFIGIGVLALHGAGLFLLRKPLAQSGFCLIAIAFFLCGAVLAVAAVHAQSLSAIAHPDEGLSFVFCH